MTKKHLDELKNNAEFIRQTLEASRVNIGDAPIAIEYDNGGGQTGIRENPEYTAYGKLLKSYQAVLTQIESVAGISDETAKARGKLLRFEDKYKKAQ